MKIKKENIVPAGCFYIFSVVIAEVTLGNPEFPLTLWRFVSIPAWQWSVPVHATGLIWLFFCNRLFYDKSIRIPITASTLYFLVCEAANWSMFHFFIYEPYPTGETSTLGSPGAAGSFWLIILLYTVLCTVTSLLLRRRTNGG